MDAKSRFKGNRNSGPQSTAQEVKPAGQQRSTKSLLRRGGGGGISDKTMARITIGAAGDVPTPSRVLGNQGTPQPP